ncbi:MAG: glutathione S-transferase family protein [Oxalobacteraceae bacterium]|nr:glutathione S-transferase family protein [Oxalobacteraceae bacterium]
MIVLCGFAASNYYNKVKLVLLEKAIPFEEKLQWVDQSAELMAKSPLGKVPYFEIDGHTLCESQVMVDYLESAYPQTPLLPKDRLAAAKVRELIQFMELHLELVARDLYGEAFFGGKASDERKALAYKQLKRGAKALAQLVSFDPYIAGSEFGLADCAALVHLPVVSMTSKTIYGEDLLAEYPLKEYLKRLGERPSVQKVNADRKENTELMREWRASRKT